MLINKEINTCDLTIVVPFYNPGPRFITHINSLIALLTESQLSFEIIAVSDGDTSEAVSNIRELLAESVEIIYLAENRGKGFALRKGFSQSNGKYVGFIDADGDIPASVLLNALEFLVLDKYSIIYGSKVHQDSHVVYPKVRRIYSACYRGLLKALFNLPINDTQTGFKIYDRKLINEVAPRLVEEGFAIDLEIFVIAVRSGFSKFQEIPVTIIQRYSSTVNLSSVFLTILSTFRIYFRIKFTNKYKKIST